MACKVKLHEGDPGSACSRALKTLQSLLRAWPWGMRGLGQLLFHTVSHQPRAVLEGSFWFSLPVGNAGPRHSVADLGQRCWPLEVDVVKRSRGHEIGHVILCRPLIWTRVRMPGRKQPWCLWWYRGACNPGVRDRGSGIQGQPSLQSQSDLNLGYRRPCFKTNK